MSSTVFLIISRSRAIQRCSPERLSHSIDEFAPRNTLVFCEVSGAVLARPAKVGLGEPVFREIVYLRREDVDKGFWSWVETRA